jgi:hypothetical protein
LKSKAANARFDKQICSSGEGFIRVSARAKRGAGSYMLPNMRITNAMAPATHPRQPSAQNMPYSGHKFCLVSGGRRVHCSQRRAHAVPVTTKKNTRIPVVQKLMSSNSSSGRWADATHNRCQELLMMELYRRDNTDSMFYFGIPLAERGRGWQRLRGCHRCRP